MLGVQSRHLVDRIDNKSFWLWRRRLADILVGREAFEHFEPSCKILSCDIVFEMYAQLFMIIVVVPLDCGIFDFSVHSLDLTTSTLLVGFGQPMPDPVRVTDHVKTHRPRMCCVSVLGLLGELDAIVGEDGVDVMWDGFE
jgi:hypothetical protein